MPTTPDPEPRAEEQRLLERALEGDPGAFGALLERHVETLRAFARRWLPVDVRRTVSPSDVVQEASLVALRRLAELEDRGPGPFRAWLLAIVRLKVREAVRRHARRRAHEGRLAAQRPAAPVVAPSSGAQSQEARDLALRALARLPPSYREVLRMARWEGVPLGEVAARLGRTREAVKKLYGRALAAFTRLAAQERGDADGRP